MLPALVAVLVPALALCAACGDASPNIDEPTASVVSDTVNPAHISRVRTELPADYEAGDLAGRSSPIAFWGLGSPWGADPPQCGALGQPAALDAPVRGWSASGPGGIVYAAVVDTATVLDPELTAECGGWTVTAGHTSARVSLVGGPAVDRAETIGMVAETTTRVEGGTETHSRAETFSAYLVGHIVLITVVTDPGSAGPALGSEFAASLLGAAVAAVRGG